MGMVLQAFNQFFLSELEFNILNSTDRDMSAVNELVKKFCAHHNRAPNTSVTTFVSNVLPLVQNKIPIVV